MNTLKELYAYREMIASLVRRDLKGRYKGSVLGFLWTFLNPLFQLGVYTLVFSTIMRSGIKDFYLFLFVALVPWIFLSTSVTGGAACVWAQQDMIKKIYFPRETLPLAYVTSQLVNMLLSLIVVLVVLIVSGKGISAAALAYLPLVIVIEYVFALAMAFLTSAITVYLRVLEYLLGIITMAWQFMTPIMYSIDQVPDRVLPFFLLNPMTSIITAYRDILYYKEIPQIETLVVAGMFSCGLFMLAFMVFYVLKRRFAEVM